MNKLKFFLILCIVTSIIIYSCKKDEFPEHPNNTLALEGDYPIISGNGTFDEDTVFTPTILGNVRINPYTVQNMTLAWNTLYPNNPQQSLIATHLYVKFSPSSIDEAKLLEQTGEMLYDFPLINEMLQLGDYYPQPGREFPELWAVVCPGFQSPIPGYVVIAQLVIPPYESILTKTAFDLTGNIWSTSEDPISIPQQNSCTPGSPDYPNCLNALNRHYGDGQTGDSDPCYQNLGGDNTTTTNNCGCVVFSDSRKPGGCVKVKDTNLGTWPGVKRVKIIMKDSWFTEDETETDDDGCWKINDRYHGKAWMWIKFVNSRCKIRGARDGFESIFDWIWPVKDHKGKIRSGPPYNNIEVKYDLWSNQGSAAHIHWGAATVNNALHEFHNYSGGEGIGAPPFLDIYVGRNTEHGYALMSGQNQISGAAFILLLNASFFIGPWGPFIAIAGASVLQSSLPDAYIGINRKVSDRLKRTAYHEIAHTSHFMQSGTEFWDDLVFAEIINNGHGQSGDPDAGIIAIAESWAEHVALTFDHNTYGGNNTAWLGADWLKQRENVRNETTNHIPIGIYNDCIDGNKEETACDYGPKICGTVIDWVSGFTNAQLFNMLDGNTRSPLILRNRILSTVGNDQIKIQQINNLFNSY